MSIEDFVTIHMGSRYPKRYCKPHELPEGVESDPHELPLHPEQPGLVKCRVKIRIHKDAEPMSAISECRDLWARLDHDAPAWIAGTDLMWVKMLAKIFGIAEVREFEPAEGDE